MVTDNVMSDINILMLNVPKDLTPLEKLRWVYIKLGNIFCYDYNYLDKDDNKSIDFENDYIGRYQSCYEISLLFNLIVNNIDENIKCEIVTRRNPFIRGINGEDHVCNIVTLSSGEKYVVDLTLDLYLIQSGCKTREFGFTTLNGDEDIVYQSKCEEMDRKLGFIKDGEYTDDKIDRIADEIYDKKYDSFDEMIDDKIRIINSLMIPFKGYQEGKNYINMLFSKLLKHNRKEFNLKYNDGKMVTCFLLNDDSHERWFIYDPALNLIETNKDIIDQMLQNGWRTKSTTLESMLGEKIK